MTQSKRTISIAIITPHPTSSSCNQSLLQLFQTALKSIHRHTWQQEIQLDIQCFTINTVPCQSDLKNGRWDCVVVNHHQQQQENDEEKKVIGFLKDLRINHPLIRIVAFGYGLVLLGISFGAELSPSSNNNDNDDDVQEKNGNPVWIQLPGFKESLLLVQPTNLNIDIEKLHETQVLIYPSDSDSDSEVKEKGIMYGTKYPTDNPPLASTSETSQYLAFDVSDKDTDSIGPHPLRCFHTFSVSVDPELSFQHENEKIQNDTVDLMKAVLFMLGVEQVRLDVE